MPGGGGGSVMGGGRVLEIIGPKAKLETPS